MENRIGGQVKSEWEKTRKSAMRIISQALGKKVDIGDDGEVWNWGTYDVIGNLGWELESENSGKWFFIQKEA